MSHNSRCASAKHPNCRCSCGGSLHGGMVMNSRRLKRKPKVFVSFHTQDRHAKELLLAQAKNRNSNLQFSNQSVDQPFRNKWKTKTKNKIRNSSTTVVMVGKDTYRRPAVQWEIEQSRKAGNKIVAVQIHKNRHHRLPPGIKKTEEMKWKTDALSKRIRKRR